MPIQLSELESKKLHTAWLACNDIKSPEFINNFKALWDSSIEEVDEILAKRSYNGSLREVKKVGVTLRPNVAFNFSFLDNAYVVNVWSFLFCYYGHSEVFFRPMFLLVSELFHEYAHFKFWNDHNMLQKSIEDRKRFNSEKGVEDEKYAHREEEKLLKQLAHPRANIVPATFQVKLFRISSWTIDGIPNCQGGTGDLNARYAIKQKIKGLQDSKRKLDASLTLPKYNSNMRNQKSKLNNAFASTLNLDCPSEASPIVWIEC